MTVDIGVMPSTSVACWAKRGAEHQAGQRVSKRQCPDQAGQAASPPSRPPEPAPSPAAAAPLPAVVMLGGDGGGVWQCDGLLELLMGVLTAAGPSTDATCPSPSPGPDSSGSPRPDDTKPLLDQDPGLSLSLGVSTGLGPSEAKRASRTRSPSQGQGQSRGQRLSAGQLTEANLRKHIAAAGGGAGPATAGRGPASLRSTDADTEPEAEAEDEDRSSVASMSSGRSMVSVASFSAWNSPSRRRGSDPGAQYAGTRTPLSDGRGGSFTFAASRPSPLSGGDAGASGEVRAGAAGGTPTGGSDGSGGGGGDMAAEHAEPRWRRRLAAEWARRR